LGCVHVNVEQPRLTEALVAALGDAGLRASTGLPPELPLASVLVEEAPESAGAVRGRVDELSERFGVVPPLVLVGFGPCALSRAAALQAGADDLLLWPRGRDELVARAVALLRRRAVDLDAHPLTGLSGGAALYRRLEQQLPHRGQLAALAFDLRHFKAFNDRYGFARGDEVIQFVARLLKGVAKRVETVYHVGGDDFFLVTRPACAEGVAARAVELFGSGIGRFYDAADLERGFILGLSRETGEELRFPLLSLTVVCATNEAADITHVGQLAQVLAELKGYAKRTGSAGLVMDRRRVHDAATSLRLRLGLAEAGARGEGEATGTQQAGTG